MVKIRVLAEDVCHQLGKDDNMLGALQLTFDKERLKAIFPRVAHRIMVQGKINSLLTKITSVI
jgi:hypothetical protein